MKSAALAISAAFMVVAGCGNWRTAGTTIETENTVFARELLVDSILPTGVAAVHGITVATLRLNSSNFDFANSKLDGRDLRLEKLDKSLLPFEVVVWDPIAKLGRLRVRLDSSLLSPRAKIRLRWGLDLSTSLADSRKTWTNIGDSQSLALNSLLMCDFENGDSTTYLPTRPFWSPYRDSLAVVTFLRVEAAGSKRSGNAFHLRFNPNGTHFAGFGTALDRQWRPFNFRSLDSMVLWVKGSGTAVISLETAGNGHGGKALVDVPLDSTWQRVRVRPSDFAIADGSGGNIGWNAVRDSVTNMTVLDLNGGTDLWVDDIRFHGLNQDDFK